MKKSDYVEVTSPQKSTIPVPNVPSEDWYEKLYHMLLGNIPFSLLLIVDHKV